MTKILFVDDEIKVLEGYRRTLHKNFQIDIALGGEQAINLIKRRGPYSVIVSDMCMPGMNGIEFLSKVKTIQPQSVRIMLTGKADQQTAIDAVNKGSIFRFLTKPCSSDTLLEVITEGIKQYEQGKSKTKLLENERRYRTVIDNIKGVIFQTDSFGRLIFLNTAWTNLTGFSVEESLGKELSHYVHPDEQSNTVELIHWLLRGVCKENKGNLRILTKQGKYLIVETSTQATFDHTGKINGLTGTFYEIEKNAILDKSNSLEFETADKTFSNGNVNRVHLSQFIPLLPNIDFYECQKILWNSNTITFDSEADRKQISKDSLRNGHVSYSNRGFFLSCVSESIQKSEKIKNHLFAVLLLDIDHFNVVNLSFGHSTGDKLLAAISERTANCLNSNDIITRFGSDDYAILLDDLKDADEAVIRAKHIQSSMMPVFDIDGNEISASVSIGIVLSDKSHKQAEEFLRDAEIALKNAKGRGRSQYEVFNSEMYSHVVSRTRLETELRRAVKHQEFLQYYQPILSLESNSLAGFEALLRWEHPKQGILPPGLFIPALEKNGMIVHVGLWGLRESCKQMVKWQHHSGKKIRLNINFSANLFKEYDLVNQVSSILYETGFEPENLNIEITESVLMENWQSVIDCLNNFRELGVELSIDDFGIGYSSLSYLQSFPISELKIDRCFVNNIGSVSEDLEIVRAIISLAKNLEIKTVAEGIETEQQLTILKELGCEFGQGYLFSKPVNADEALKLVSKLE